jgi:capsule polysaccharide export protein KpsE/RkpR
VTYPTGTHFRQTVPELPESEFRGGMAPPEKGDPRHDTVARWRLLWDHRRLLFRVAVYAALASSLLSLLIPTKYESTTRLMPPDNGGSSGLASALAAISGGASSGMGLAALASDFLGLKSTSDTFVGILSSRTAEDKIIQQFDLKKVYGTRRIEDTRKMLANRTDIAVDRKSQIITVTITDHDPKRAQGIGQAYVEQLNRLVAELSTSSARRERIFLEGRLQEVTKDLESAEKAFGQFSSKNSTLDIKEQGKAMVEAAATLQGELIAAESELEGLRQIYSDNNVRVRSLHARVDELKQELGKIAGQGEDTSAPIAQQDLYPSIRKLPLLGVTYADLYREAKVQEVVYETLTKEYELAKVQEVKEIPVVKVLDLPDIPDKKSFPPRALIVVLGTLLALVGAATWIFGKASWEQTDAADPRKIFAQEVLLSVKAHVSRLVSNGSGEHRGMDRAWRLLRRERDEDEAAR